MEPPQNIWQNRRSPTHQETWYGNCPWNALWPPTIRLLICCASPMIVEGKIKLEVAMPAMKNQITCPDQQGTRKWENQTRTKWKFMKDKTDKNQTSKELFWYKKNENQTRIKDKIIFFSAVLLGVFQCSHLKKCPDEEGYGVHGGHCRHGGHIQASTIGATWCWKPRPDIHPLLHLL